MKNASSHRYTYKYLRRIFNWKKTYLNAADTSSIAREINRRIQKKISSKCVDMHKCVAQNSEETLPRNAQFKYFFRHGWQWRLEVIVPSGGSAERHQTSPSAAEDGRARPEAPERGRRRPSAAEGARARPRAPEGARGYW